LMKYKNLEELQALDKSGNLHATIALSLIYVRDIIPSKPVVFEKFSEAPIDHELAKKCLIKLESNILFISFAREFKEFLGKFEKSASPNQKSCTF